MPTQPDILRAPPAARQPNCPAGRLDVTARSETVRRVVPVYGASCWTRRPTARPNGWGGAELVIGGTVYKAESCWFDDADGRVWQIADLFKAGGKHIRVLFGADCPDGSCDCEQATYRGVTCKHVAAVRAALDWLGAVEQEEWEAAIAAVPGAAETDTCWHCKARVPQHAERCPACRAETVPF
jgi:hypothetical protein